MCRHVKFGIVVGVPFVTELLYVAHYVMNVKHGTFQEDIAQRDSGFSVAVHVRNGRNALLVVFAFAVCARYVFGHAPHVDIAEIAAYKEEVAESIADGKVAPEVADFAVVV